MTTANRKADRSYHHGHLKEALVNRALEMIESGDVGSITVRRLCKEVGVTPSAAYNHFTDKNELLLAVKICVYTRFNEYMEAHIHQDADPEQQLENAAFAYLRFAAEQPARFAFLFDFSIPLKYSTPEAIEIACYNLVRARKLILGLCTKYRIQVSEAETVDAALLLWSQLHGIAQLRRSGSIGNAVALQGWPQECGLLHVSDTQRLARKQIDYLLNGLIDSSVQQAGH